MGDVMSYTIMPRYSTKPKKVMDGRPDWRLILVAPNGLSKWYDVDEYVDALEIVQTLGIHLTQNDLDILDTDGILKRRAE
jgi:hypothetical protein